MKRKLAKLKEQYGNEVQITEEAEEMLPQCDLSEEKILVEACVQSGYLSPVELLLADPERVLRRESDLERVKKAIDVLCKAIGYQNLEEVMGEQGEPAFEDG